jgi:hypothetical protein
MEMIYEDGTPKLTLMDLAEELALMGELGLAKGERVCRCRLEDGETLVVDVVRSSGLVHLAHYETDVGHLRDIGIGGTAKYIAFGRDEDGEDVLFTFGC